MSRRNFRQPSLADAFVKSYCRKGGFLEDIARTFEWAAFDVLMRPLHSSSDGAPAYPPLTMFKIVLLQQWYGLSDPGAEEAVRDRLSFRRFCGVPLDEETPDHSSIWRFRQRLAKLGLSEQLLAEVTRQLAARRLIVKRGTLVDATIIAAAVQRPPIEDGQVNARDPDAGFTVKNGETYFGYKAHVWMPPFAQDVFEWCGRVIGCGHVSGLQMRLLRTAGRYGDARTRRRSAGRAFSSLRLIAFPGPDLTDHLSLPFVDILTRPTSPWLLVRSFDQAAAATGTR